MHRSVFSLALASFLLFAGCEKKENPADSTPQPTGGIFTTANVKLSPSYFSFDGGDTVASSKAWDIELTTMFAPEDTTRSFQFPGIALNRALDVRAKIVNDGTYESVDPVTVTGLQTDPNDTTFVIGTNCLYYTGPPAHRLNPYDNRTFVVQTASGKHAKFRMLSYYNDQGASGFMKFEYAVK